MRSLRLASFALALTLTGGAAAMPAPARGRDAWPQDPQPASYERERRDAAADERARATEEQMTDDERFALIVSLMGAVPSIGVPRDQRIPADVQNMSAGYTPG